MKTKLTPIAVYAALLIWVGIAYAVVGGGQAAQNAPQVASVQTATDGQPSVKSDQPPILDPTLVPTDPDQSPVLASASSGRTDEEIEATRKSVQKRFTEAERIKIFRMLVKAEDAGNTIREKAFIQGKPDGMTDKQWGESIGSVADEAEQNYIKKSRYKLTFAERIAISVEGTEKNWIKIYRL